MKIEVKFNHLCDPYDQVEQHVQMYKKHFGFEPELLIICHHTFERMMKNPKFDSSILSQLQIEVDTSMENDQGLLAKSAHLFKSSVA